MRPDHLIAVVMAVLLCFTGMTRAAAPPNEPADADAKPVVAFFELSGPLMESRSDELMLFGKQQASLRDLSKRLRAAGADQNVKAVVLRCDSFSAGPAQVEELRQALTKLREKGKDVYFHSDTMMMNKYLLASGATRISIVPTGMLMITGLHGEAVYIRNLLDKLGVKPEVVHVGPYKSAGEMFMRDGPTPEADEMFNWMFDSYFDIAVKTIADGRKTTADKAKAWIDKGLYTAEQAKESGLIDAVENPSDLDALLKKKYGEGITFERKYGQEKEPQLDFSNPFAMFKILGEMFGGKQKSNEPEKPTVGIVYVDGMILTGKSEPSPFGSGGAHSGDIRNALDAAARDDMIKAVVLRIDSPGGSATASEIILDATQRLKKKKPLVVSMGNVAGSGGYYVAMGAETIFADSTTLTGSIGVLSGKFTTTDMWKKVGITFKSYGRGKNANLLATDRVWTDDQKKDMQGLCDAFYATFTKHVMDNRGNKLKKPLEDVAGGRVFTGKQALEIGLIDKIGTMNDAIEYAAIQAGLKDYDTRVVPKSKNFIERLMEDATGGENDRQYISSAHSGLAEMAMPYLRDLDPKRVQAIRAGLGQLQVLGQEGILMAMPELLIDP